MAFKYQEWPTVESITTILEEVKNTAYTYLRQQIVQTARLPLLVHCVDPPEDVGGHPRAHVLRFREYLDVKIPNHRHALTRLLIGGHPLSIERLRMSGVKREWRICRFCKRQGVLEDEIHILFECDSNPQLRNLRAIYAEETMECLPPIDRNTEYRERREVAVIHALAHREATPALAKLVSDVFEVLDGSEALIIRSLEQYQELDVYWHA